MILRCTAKVLALLSVPPAALHEVKPHDDDWYLNLIWIERRKCLLLTHAGTLFPIFVADIRKGDITPIGPYIADLVKAELLSEELDLDTLGSLDRDGVRLAKTASRSILGVMNDTAFHARYQVETGGGIGQTHDVLLNRFLRRALHNREGEYVTPLDLVARRHD
jgi:hypothetical protein